MAAPPSLRSHGSPALGLGTGPILHMLSVSILGPRQWGTWGPSQGAATMVPDREEQEGKEKAGWALWAPIRVLEFGLEF